MLHRRASRLLVVLALALAGGAPAAAAGGTPDIIPGDDWRGYNKTLDGQRYSPLDQINVSNAAYLKEVCRIEVAHRGSFQAGPVMIGDTLYVTAEEKTLALDARTCAVRWRHVYRHQQQGISPMNRGVAWANHRLFRGTEDAHVIALDDRTGEMLWDSVAGDARLAEYVATAPLVWNGLVIVGTGGSEWGVKGRIMAFDAATGREVWRFSTIPTGKERGADTWKNGRWAEHGGGGSWSSFALDPVTAELFAPIANPVPDFSPSDRPGDNLFTNSVLVLDARTGSLRWWFQLTPNDGMDWDLAAAPMLYRDAGDQDVVAAAGKDGYLHLIDRVTHKERHKIATTTVEPLPVIGTTPVKVCPGAAGGTLWNGPAFDPRLQLVFIGALDLCALVTRAPGQTYGTWKMLYGGTWQPTLDPPSGWITAVDATTGAVRWKYHAEAPVLSALTPTAGGIMFGGDNAGNLLILESASGKVLKRIATGGSLSGGIVTYLIEGQQFVAVDSGNISRTGFGAVGRPNVILYRLGDDAPAPTVSTEDAVARGLRVYQHGCLGCHATDGSGIHGFELKGIKQRMTHTQLIEWIRNPRPPMPRVFAEPLDADDLRDLEDLAAYLER
jgi:alcohol dehydrogenase (cytochrome c)